MICLTSCNLCFSPHCWFGLEVFGPKLYFLDFFILRSLDPFQVVVASFPTALFSPSSHTQLALLSSVSLLLLLLLSFSTPAHVFGCWILDLWPVLQFDDLDISLYDGWDGWVTWPVEEQFAGWLLLLFYLPYFDLRLFVCEPAAWSQPRAPVGQFRRTCLTCFSHKIK